MIRLNVANADTRVCNFPILVNFFATPTRDRTFGLQIRQAALLATEAHALQLRMAAHWRPP